MDQLDPLKRSEDKTLEFKRHLSSPDRALKTIVAFANTAGGILLIGVEDRRRDVLSVAKPLEEEERLANLFSYRISPLLLPEIEILPWRQTQVLALQVYPSPSRRHHLIREGPAGGMDVRVGSTNRADAELIEALQRFSRGEGFDEQPLPSLSSEAIDVRAASESFAPLRALRRRDLESLRLVADHQGKRKQSPSCGRMPGRGPPSARFAVATAGACRPRPCARP